MIKVSGTGDGQRRIGRSYVWKLIGIRTGLRILIERGADDGYVDVRGIERELPKIGHGKDAEATAQHSFAVGERAIRKTDARLEILRVELTDAGTESDGACESDRRARKRRIYRSASELGVDGPSTGVARVRGIGGIAAVDALEESGAWLGLPGDDDAAVVDIEGSKISLIADKGRQCLPTQTERERQSIIQTPFVLSVDSCLSGVGMNIGARLGHVGLCGHTEKKIRERIASEDSLIEIERAKVVGTAKAFDVYVGDAPHIRAKFHGVLTFDPGEIIYKLDGLGLRGAGFVATDRSEGCAIAEVESGKSIGSGMIAKIETLQAKGGNGLGALDGKKNLQLVEGEAEAGFIDEIVGEQIVVGDDQVFVVLQIAVTGKKIVRQGGIARCFQLQRAKMDCLEVNV